MFFCDIHKVYLCFHNQLYYDKMKHIDLFLWIIIALCPISLWAEMDSKWCIEANSKENYNGITLANGHLGLVAGANLFSVSEIVLNGVFDKVCEGGVSRMVCAPKATNLHLKIDGKLVDSLSITAWKQVLNMKEAYLKTSVVSQGVHINYTLRALRNLPYMFLGVVEVTPDKEIVMEVVNHTDFSSELQCPSTHFKVMCDGEVTMPVLVSQANSLTGMQKLTVTSAFLFDVDAENKAVKDNSHGMSFSRTLKQGETYRFALVGAVCTSRDFADPKNESERMVVFALRHSVDHLIEGHRAAWKELWKGDIEIEGCEEDQRDIRLALYHLYSFQRKGSRLSISPMGLSSSTGYNGHVFWDSEIWMYPPMLLLNQDLAKAHIDYRFDRLGKALKRAEMFGYKGAMFPWESDDSGEESTPTWCLTGTFEHHITADIGIAFWNYYRVTKDKKWLLDEGFPVLKAVADFWVSRATKNKDGSYSICNVVGANEYAPNVDDNAFTNGSAKVALREAVKAACVLNLDFPAEWEDVAEGLCFHYMDDGTMKEHASYQGETIKQADVNLLAYPLGIVCDKQAVYRDLLYYKDKIDQVNGPAMGNAILSVLYARMGDIDEAYRFFKKSYVPNKRPPFGVLSESPSSNNPYFATGAGGMLQAVLFGFAGLELTDQGIVERSVVLPRQWKSLTIRGIGTERKNITIKNY